MREIEFRAKHTWDGSFKYGYLVHVPADDSYRITQGKEISYFVDPETIGQYTGLKDKNGTKIFEGDILADMDDQVCGVVEWDENDSGFGISIERDWYRGEVFADLEIIGNIYDNPELLEVKDEHN